MRITAIEYWEFPLTLREPYTIAYHTVSKVTNVGLVLTMEDGRTGFGCAGPEEEVSQETSDTVLNALKEVIEPLLHNYNFNSIDDILRELERALRGQRAALAMVEMALFDYLAKKADVALYKYLGGKKNHIPTSITVNIYPPEETLSRVKGWLEKGFSILKLKGGLSLEDDVQKISLIRKDLGFKLPIFFDANQGYSFEETVQFCDLIKDQNILCIEQPVHKTATQNIITLAKENSIPLMVDESLNSEQDALHFARYGVQFFNIKLMKTGGIKPSTLIAQIAYQYGTKIIVSCMDECAYINAAGLHFALAQGNIDFVDLDSFTDYTVDPTGDSILFKDGFLWACDKPGIGFSPF